MFVSYSYLRQYNDNKPIEDYKSYYRTFSNSREFGGEFSNFDHLVKNRFHDMFGHVFNAILRKQPENILDMGCGNGVNLPFSRVFPQVDFHGLDYAEQAIASARTTYPNVTFHVDDAFNTKFSDDAFDMVILSSVLILYRSESDQSALMREIQRILRPNGVLVLIVWNQSPLLTASIRISRILGWFFRQDLPMDFMGVYFHPKDIRRLASKLKLQIEERVDTGVNYGVLESARYLNFGRYNRRFGKSESEAGQEHSQHILTDLKRQAGRLPWLTSLCYALSRLNPRWFSMYSIYMLRKPEGLGVK